jgi:AcrR family transcriptional regulator
MARAALTPDEISSFRRAICEAATRLFAEHGYGGVTLRGISSEVGCSPMTPYRYFADKDAIFTAVRAAAFERFAEALRGTPHDIDPEERLAALGKAYVQFALEEPHAYRVMFELSQPATPGDPELAASERSAWKQLRGAVVRSLDAGVVCGDPDDLAHYYWAALHGLVSLHLAGKLRLGRSLEQLVTPMLRALIDGTRPRPETRDTRQGETA